MPQSHMTQLRMTRRRVLGAGAALAAAPLVAGLLTTPAAAAAPMLGPLQSKHLRFKLGAFEITMISDSEAFIDGPWPLIGKNDAQSAVDQLMRDNLLPANKYRPGFTPMVVNTGKELILFDTGNGARGFVPRPAGGWLAAQLAPAGLKPEDIDLVVLSHGHPDHIGGVIENGKPLFANARYAIGGTEYDFWSPAGKHTGDLEKYSALFRDLMVPLAEKTTFLKPGDDVASGIRAVEAFGHTPGHLAFHIDGGGKELFWFGDIAHHQVASLARPDWHCVFDVDPKKASETRARVLEMLAADRVAVCGYHMPFPSIGYVERLPSGSRTLPARSLRSTAANSKAQSARTGKSRALANST